MNNKPGNTTALAIIAGVSITFLITTNKQKTPLTYQMFISKNKKTKNNQPNHNKRATNISFNA